MTKSQTPRSIAMKRVLMSLGVAAVFAWAGGCDQPHRAAPQSVSEMDYMTVRAMQSQQTAAGLCAARGAAVPFPRQQRPVERPRPAGPAGDRAAVPPGAGAADGPARSRACAALRAAQDGGARVPLEQGVKTASVSINNDALDGDGMSSEQVRAALDKMNTSAAAPDSGSTPSGSSSSAPPNNQSGGSQK